MAETRVIAAWSYGLHGGLRAQLGDCMFVELSGDYGLVGPYDYGAQLMVGFFTM